MDNITMAATGIIIIILPAAIIPVLYREDTGHFIMAGIDIIFMEECGIALMAHAFL
jgi:hypothetical protein